MSLREGTGPSTSFKQQLERDEVPLLCHPFSFTRKGGRHVSVNKGISPSKAVNNSYRSIRAQLLL